ncbi:MAG: dihydroorotase [Dethiobacter sp.]|nr:dihydroorotase [Dethiobacter sp.]MCL5982902.1 dihydroorotase [Bacillota bacterium]
MGLLIRGGTLVDPVQGLHGRYDLLVRDGVVAKVAPQIDAAGAEVLEAAGRMVLPGLIDLHTHLREPGFEQKETVDSACRAAAAGGFTSITAMPNTDPVMDDSRTVEYVRLLAGRASLVRVWPVGAVSKGLAGRELAEIGLMVRSGIRAVTDDGHGVADARLLKNALLYCRQFNLPLFEHCEDEALARGGQVHDGVVALRLGLPGLPVSAETVMLARDLLLAAETGGRLHVMHVSTAQAVEMIRRAKADGVPVTAEVTPHHLLLTEEAVLGFNTMAKMKPPLRTAADVQALREALLDGTIDAIATDHAPHTEAEKAGDFLSAPFGVVGLETAFPLLYTELVLTGIMTVDLLVEKMSCAPARILGVPHGSLAPGCLADLVVVDTQAKRVIDRWQFYSRGKNTPFHGWAVSGLPVLTMVGGRVVMRGTQLLTNH